MSSTGTVSHDQLSTDPPLGALVTANPATARVLEGFGLDYCCGGQTRLTIACLEAGLDPDEVRAAIAALDVSSDVAWADLEPADLIAHILETHHAYLRTELPALVALAATVASVHGERHVELVEVAALVVKLWADLEPHLAREELALFPAILRLAENPELSGIPPSNTEPTAADLEAGLIAALRFEHDRTGELLGRIRTCTSSFELPADACASYTSLYQRLEALEVDTHLHVHKENNMLFEAVAGL